MALWNGTAPSPALVQAIRRALRPLVRVMLASGVTYPIVSEILKGVFVDTADREFRLAHRNLSDSRVSLISGVHRKDVRRLRNGGQGVDEGIPDAVSFGGRLVTAWLSEKRFLDKNGQPKPLPKTRTPDGSLCFEDLVASRSTDIGPRAVLDEWLRLGIVAVDAEDRVVLKTHAFVPQLGLEEKLFFFAHNLHDHGAAATDNLLGGRPPQLDRSLIYEGLMEDGVAEVDKRARHLGNRMLQELNRVASKCEDTAPPSNAPRYRLTCGVYFYSEPIQDSKGGSTGS